MRAAAFGGLLRLPIAEAEYKQAQFDPNRLLTCTEFAIAEGDWQVQSPSEMHAKALRAKGSPADLDAGDVVEMKSCTTHGRLPEAITLGLVILRERRDSDPQAREEGTAFFMSAWEDAKIYISEASPDGRLMLAVVGCEDLRKLDLNLTRNFVLRLYANGAQEWRVFVKQLGRIGARARGSHLASSFLDVEDHLAEWLETLGADGVCMHTMGMGVGAAKVKGEMMNRNVWI
ncbi:hypothetical protein C8Q77DRAFT_1154417 [Trametes polyzona]|nr:hypothetical protein C8Q77DRAFT_1154417 [Trametes polyzona]